MNKVILFIFLFIFCEKPAGAPKPLGDVFDKFWVDTKLRYPNTVQILKGSVGEFLIMEDTVLHSLVFPESKAVFKNQNPDASFTCFDFQDSYLILCNDLDTGFIINRKENKVDTFVIPEQAVSVSIPFKNPDTFFIASWEKVFVSYNRGNSFDTFFSTPNILSLLKRNDTLYLLTQKRLYTLYPQEDIVYNSLKKLKAVAFDKQGNMYLLEENKVLRRENDGWKIFFEGKELYDIKGIKDGILALGDFGEYFEILKEVKDSKEKNISYGLIVSDEPEDFKELKIAVGEDAYLLIFPGTGETFLYPINP